MSLGTLRPGRVWALLLFLFAVSGASGLVYEIVWMRRLALVFGSTTLAVSTVLAAFMGGLALGSDRFGRVADRRPGRRLALYARLETAIGILAIVIPPLLAGTRPGQHGGTRPRQRPVRPRRRQATGTESRALRTTRDRDRNPRDRDPASPGGRARRLSPSRAVVRRLTLPLFRGSVRAGRRGPRPA